MRNKFINNILSRLTVTSLQLCYTVPRNEYNLKYNSSLICFQLIKGPKYHSLFIASD